MSEGKHETIGSPRGGIGDVMPAIVAFVFAGTLVVASQRENNVWYLVGGIAVAVVGIILAFQYEQTVVDLTDRKWIRTSGGLFGKKSKDGPLDELASVGIQEGVDSKGHKTWKVTLNRKVGRYIEWHRYTYLGEKGMRSDVARLEAALGLPIMATFARESDDEDDE